MCRVCALARKGMLSDPHRSYRSGIMARPCRLRFDSSHQSQRPSGRAGTRQIRMGEFRRTSRLRRFVTRPAATERGGRCLHATSAACQQSLRGEFTNKFLTGFVCDPAKEKAPHQQIVDEVLSAFVNGNSYDTAKLLR